MSGMFWHNNYAQSVQIDLLLSEENITLRKLMDAEDILQECKSQNKKLIEYLTRSDILEELVNLITEEPSHDLEESRRYKYSNVACELLTSDVPVLTEKLAGNEMLLSKLYAFIDKEQPLNPLLASFFSKTLHALLRRATDQNWISHQFVCLQVLESLKSRKNYVDLLLQHIQTSAIMDLILILLTKIEGDEMRQNILNWLDDQQLVQRLVKLLSPSSDPERHTNASQLLCDIIHLPFVESEKRPDVILQSLQSEETVKLILKTILSERTLESSIVGGVRILIKLLGQKENEITESNETYGIPFNNIIENKQRIKIALIIIHYLDKFNGLLLFPPEKPSVKTTAEYIVKPFGRSRLYILKLYASILTTGNVIVLQKILELDTFNILLDLFFQFTWNNFLHTQVQQCLFLTLNCDFLGKDKIVYSHIFIQSKLIDRILEAWEKTLNERNGFRPGYMGHLIVIANEISKQCEENNVFLNFLKENLCEITMQKWQNFILSELDAINKKQHLALGEPPEVYLMSSTGNSEEYTTYLQESYGQELTNCQKQTPTPVYMKTVFDFQLENREDGYEAFQQRLGSLKDHDVDYVKTQELFNKICEEKKFEDINSDEQWGKISDIQNNKSDWLSKKKHNSSSSSEDEQDEEYPHELYMRTDTIDPWNSIREIPVSPSSSVNFWSVKTPQPVEQTGWANFDNFSGAFSINQVNSCNEIENEITEKSSFVDNILFEKNNFQNTSTNIISRENLNQVDDIHVKTEVKNVPSLASYDCSETSVNISNITLPQNINTKLEGHSADSEENFTSISSADPENVCNFQIIVNATEKTVIKSSK